MQHYMLNLAQQLRIGEHEIERRKVFLGLTIEDEQNLKTLLPWIKPHVKALVKDFYELQLQIPEIAFIIGDCKTLSRLHNNLEQYVLDLFSGRYDLAYVEKRLEIGKIHHRIGVSPRLYLSGTNQLQILLENLIEEYSEEKQLNSKQLKQSMRKILYLDNQFIFDTYIAALQFEVQSVNDQLEAYATKLQNKVNQRTKELLELSLHDPLTNLYNRRAFHDQTEMLTTIIERQQKHMAGIYIDVNKFKSINDNYGHLAGDEVLVSLANAIFKTMNKTQISARFGGDEFCILLPEMDIQASAKLIQNLLAEFDNLCPYPATLSIGCASINPVQGYNLKEMLRRADTEMYHAKKAAHQSGRHEISLDLIKV